jgi:hypothetical protein
MSAALAETGQRIKVRHSRYSRLRLAEARQALAIVHSIAEEFAAQVAELTATTVTDRQWSAFLDAHAPIQPDPRRDHRLPTRHQPHGFEGRRRPARRPRRSPRQLAPAASSQPHGDPMPSLGSRTPWTGSRSLAARQTTAELCQARRGRARHGRRGHR